MAHLLLVNTLSLPEGFLFRGVGWLENHPRGLAQRELNQ
jgi:hypothetical protein